MGYFRATMMMHPSLLSPAVEKRHLSHAKKKNKKIGQRFEANSKSGLASICITVFGNLFEHSNFPFYAFSPSFVHSHPILTTPAIPHFRQSGRGQTGKCSVFFVFLPMPMKGEKIICCQIRARPSSVANPCYILKPPECALSEL